MQLDELKTIEFPARMPQRKINRNLLLFMWATALAVATLLSSKAQAEEQQEQEPSNTLGVRATYNLLEKVPGVVAFYRRGLTEIYGLGLDLHVEFGNFTVQSPYLTTVKSLSGYAMDASVCLADLDFELSENIEFGLCPIKVGGGFNHVGTGIVGYDQTGERYVGIAPTYWFGLAGAEVGLTLKSGNFGIGVGFEAGITTPTFEGYAPRGAAPYSLKELNGSVGASYSF